MEIPNREKLSSLFLTELDTDVAKPLLGLHIVVADDTPSPCFAAFLEELGAWTEGSGSGEVDPARVVPELGADLGLRLQEDGLKITLFDEKGIPFSGNRFIALCTAVVMDEAASSSTIVTDSLTSVGVTRFINNWNAEHYRYKRGSERVLEEARRLNESGVPCPLAVTVTGHAAFLENDFAEDGLYTASRLIGKAMALKQEGQKLSDLVNDLKEPVERASLRLTITAPDYRHAGVTAVDMVLARANGSLSWHIAPDNREGVRIFRDINSRRDACFIQLRLSLKSPVLGIHLESDVAGGIRQTLETVLECIGRLPGIDYTPVFNLLKTGEGLELSKGEVSQ